MLRRWQRKVVVQTGLTVVLLLLVAAQAALACTCITVTKGASVDGSVMTTHTCDSGTDDFRIRVVPRQKHAAGTMHPLYRGAKPHPDQRTKVIKTGEIPEVAETYAYFDGVAYPIMNEYQVAMGETSIGGRPELRNADGIFNIEELQRLALQRCKTAREAVKLMGALAEEYGYGDGGEYLSVCDPNEAWAFEIYGATPLKKGAVWSAVRIPDGHVHVSCNRPRNGKIDPNDPDNCLLSSNVFSLAEQMGWWDPKSGKEFVFYEAYYGPQPRVYSSRREWRVFDRVAPSLKLDPRANRFPHSVKAERKLSVQDILTIQRDHYEGTEFDLTKGYFAGPFGNPNRQGVGSVKGAFERVISSQLCTYSFCSQSRSWLPNPIGGVLWFGPDAPHSTCYVPFYCGVAKLPASYATGTRSMYSADSAWWAFDHVGNMAEAKWCYMVKDIQAVYQALENEFFALQPVVEKVAAGLYAVSPELAVSFLTNYSNDAGNRTVKAYLDLARYLITKYNDRGGGPWPEEWVKAGGFGPVPEPQY